MARQGEIIGVVDFGAQDIRVLIARKQHDGIVQLLGHGIAAARGCVAQGVIQDLGAAQSALNHALKAAEKEAGLRIRSLFCGVNGKNVDTYIREGNVELQHDAVEKQDLEEALDTAQRDLLSPGKKIISSITSEEWYIDDLRVSDPIGLRGSILKGRVHFAVLPTVIRENIQTCIESQARELEDIIFLPLAAGLGCLTPEDIDLGCAIVDMGRTTTGIAIYRDRRILGAHTFEWGGFHITRDVAAGLQISFEEAAELIQLYGISDVLIQAADEVEEGEMPQFPENGGKETPIKLKTAVHGAPSIVDRAELDAIVFARAFELMTKIRQFLKARGLAKNLVRGIVLTGGAAQIKNMPALAESIFSVPARVGLPEGIDVLPQPIHNPTFVPAVGLVRHAFEYRAALRNGRLDVEHGFVGGMARWMLETIRKYIF